MLFSILQIITTIFVVLAMSASLGHALELPGKMRLSKEIYNSVQHIYYPGFTIAGGIGEAGGIVLLVILLCMTPTGNTSFWLTALALTGLICMQVIYWIFTHPINKFWLQNTKLDNFSGGFFSILNPKNESRSVNWKLLRNRWEYSHVVRAGFAFISFLSLLITFFTGSL